MSQRATYFPKFIELPTLISMPVKRRFPCKGVYGLKIFSMLRALGYSESLKDLTCYLQPNHFLVFTRLSIHFSWVIFLKLH